MTDPLDPEEGPDSDYPYCEALNGLGPHNYQPYFDIVGHGSYLYCNQCGDFVEVLAPSKPQGAAAGSSPTSPSTAPSSSKPGWP